MRPRVEKPVPEALRHRILPCVGGFELVTHGGHVLRTFATIEEAREFYAWHCPSM